MRAQDIQGVCESVNQGMGRKGKKIAELLGKPYSTLMNELNPNIAGHKLGLFDFMDYVLRTGNYEALDRVCQIAGGVFVRLEKATATDDPLLRQAYDMVRSGMEVGGVVYQITSPESEGGVNIVESEARIYRCESHALIRKVLTVEATVNDMAIKPEGERRGN